ncbi:MAG: hypothetical protein IJR52_06490 [Selenomonadaceae bacterium]|nr:hypothetical protein [Selenomonadaceae bacterium]
MLGRVLLFKLMKNFLFDKLLSLCVPKEKEAKRKGTSQGRLPFVIRSIELPVLGVRRMPPSRRQTRRGRHP